MNDESLKTPNTKRFNREVVIYVIFREKHTIRRRSKLVKNFIFFAEETAASGIFERCYLALPKGRKKKRQTVERFNIMQKDLVG